MLSCAFVFWLAGVAVCDFAKRRVPNRWLLAGAILAIVALIWNVSPLAVTWQQALAGGIGAFTILLGFYALGMMGAGDVKFAGVLGLWLGGPALVPIAVGAGVLAFGHALFCLARRHGPSLTGRRRCADGDATAVAATNLDAPVTGTGPRTGPTMNGAIPYAGYLALMALLWVASGPGPMSH